MWREHHYLGLTVDTSHSEGHRPVERSPCKLGGASGWEKKGMGKDEEDTARIIYK